MISVIGAGMPRTGTLSLKSALDRLGFGPSYHMFELMRRPGRVTGWLAAAEGRPVDWAAVLSGYRSAVDWPASFFYRELADAYPDAKVVLTVRDPQRWFDSSERLLRSNHLRSMVSRPVSTLVPFVGRMNRLMSHISATTFRIDHETAIRGTVGRARAVEAFQRHNAEVQRLIPADRLLVFDVRDGWEPLCAFLGVPVPGVPFPHDNEAGTFEQDLNRRTRAMYARNLAGAGGAAVALGAAALVYRRVRRRAGAQS
jgi:hypothetical protein